MKGIAALVQQVETGRPEVANEYPRSVQPEGNPKAQELMRQVFEICDPDWRGIGVVPDSGLRLREEFARYDVIERLDIELIAVPDNPACHCGEVLRGVMRPQECGAFGKACTPERPLGPCMVSSEGSCAAVYKYE